MKSVTTLLDRPPEQRALEFKYRFGQAVVFGLPVLALQAWGMSLGGNEAERWVAVLQALLAGWVVYVAATGMVVDGLLQLTRRRMTADLLVGTLAPGLYGWSTAALLTVPINGALWHRHTMFHVCVAVLGAWSGARWAWMKWSTRPRQDVDRRGRA
jgi:cation transport ATPase